ncbi:MAG: type II toxin-antitoxin system Phd/YefM family antitoxin [Coleofasciculus sp. Co-bin14]|nr:type II toxin-antitoxin system Phd/YefM family antitoxin [Coleofasciculus sp. Co-bin14]
MQSYTLTDTHNRLSEVFEKAVTEPVLVIEQSRPSHVIMSADTYQRLLKRLEELEDMLLGQAADAALKNSHMVGVETFTSTLQRLANGEA